MIYHAAFFFSNADFNAFIYVRENEVKEIKDLSITQTETPNIF